MFLKQGLTPWRTTFTETAQNFILKHVGWILWELWETLQIKLQKFIKLNMTHFSLSQ